MNKLFSALALTLGLAFAATVAAQPFDSYGEAPMLADRVAAGDLPPSPSASP